jgi:hypothetical protein
VGKSHKKEEIMLNKQEIAKFIEESVQWLIAEQQGCCHYKLDDHLAICVGWSGGYDGERDGILIQAEDDPTYAINAGIKVWTSDAAMLTDYDWINAPYYQDGDVLETDCSISYQEDYEWLAQYLLKMYEEMKNLELANDGLILGRNE